MGCDSEASGQGDSIHTAVGEMSMVSEGKTVSTCINRLWCDQRVGHHRDLR